MKIKFYLKLLALASMALFSVEANAQITGTVTDINNEPLVGTNVTVKGTPTGTSVDVNGKYSLNAPASATTLVFSFIGYISQEVTIGNQKVINVQLKEDLSTLDEIVVIAYGTVKKSDITGSVSSLKEKDFNKGVNNSIDQLITGRAAGVQVSQTSSEPGGGVSIRIRGANSITAGNEPLYVIDGFPIDNSNLLQGGGAAATGSTEVGRNPLSSLNPADIASVEILKDASATAIYGARGANGVVLITTKTGGVGKTKVSYDAYYGHQQAPRRLETLNTAEYIQVMNEIGKEELGKEVFSAADIARIGEGVDWQSQVFRSAPIVNQNISFSGGSAKTTFFTSLNYFDQQGVVKETGMKRFGGRLNLNNQVSDKFKIGINLNTSVQFDDFALDNSETNEAQGPVYAAVLYDPTEAIYKADGSFNHSSNLTTPNPASLIAGIDSKGQTNRTFGNVNFNYKILEGLDAKINLGSDRQTVRRDIYNSRLTLRGTDFGGLANIASLELTNYLAEYTMNYNKDINESNRFSILGGVTYQRFSRRSVVSAISSFPTDALGWDNLALGDPTKAQVASNKQENTLLSYLGRANYTLNNKYLFTASIRADGSSRFGTNNKYGIFPSAAFAWKLSEEDFIPDALDLKLRLSWGKTGNQEIGNYTSLSTLGNGGQAVFNNAIFSSTQPTRIANPDLKWETTTQTNVGLDFGLALGRISGSIDYFNKNTNDLLLNLPIPRSTGYTSILTNIGEVKNSGIELQLNSTNVSIKDFKWTTSFNIAAIKNQAVDIGGLDQIITGALDNVGNSAIITPGEPIFSYYGYKITGIFNTKEEVAASAQKSSKPGYPIFQDTNGDGAITPADQVILGKPFPDFTAGLGNDISYKGFNLNFFIQAVQGVENINVQAVQSMYPANFRRNKFSKQFLDRWSPTNLDGKYPSGVSPSAYGGGKVNNLTIEDASFIRLRTATLSYSVPLKNKNVFQNLGVYVTAQNLLTISNYIGWDPEASLKGNSSGARADDNSYPLTKSFLFGLSAGF
jgi:TonB-dependent starch-binding outer membrane protein SusC